MLENVEDLGWKVGAQEVLSHHSDRETDMP